MAIILAEKFSVSFDEAKANIKELANGIAEQYAHDLAHELAHQLRRQLGSRGQVTVISRLRP